MAYGLWPTDRLALGGIHFPTFSLSTVHPTSIGAVKRSGTITPNYKRYKRLTKQTRSILPINDFRYQKDTWNPLFGDVAVRWPLSPGSNYSVSGIAVHTQFGIPAIDSCWEPGTSEVNAVDNKAIQKLLEEIKGQKVNLAQVFAERKMTADLIGNTVCRINQSIMALRRGDIRKAARMLRANVSRSQTARFNSEYRLRRGGNSISNSWLELQYGWRPLISDVYGSAEWLADRQYREIKANARGTARIIEDEYSESTQYLDKTIHKSEGSFQIRYGAWFQSTGVSLPTLKESGFLNPALLAWELMPWSFVADWFIPIGNYLATLDATVGLVFDKGYRTSYLNSSRQMTIHGYGKNIDFAGRTFSGYGSTTRIKVAVSRDRVYSFPSMSFPSFKSPWSFEHAANAIALLSQAFSKNKA